MDFNEKNATEAVLNSFAGIKDDRLKRNYELYNYSFTRSC